MAKTKSAAPAGTGNNPDLRELIVVTQRDAAIVASHTEAVSLAGAATNSLNAILAQHNATLIPLFGSETRSLVPRAGQLMPSTEAVSGLAGFYTVDTTANKDELAAALLNDPNIAGAYVKPEPQPPVKMDQIPLAAPEDAPPVTPDFVPSQIYLNPAPAGIDAKYAWTLTGGKGSGVRIIDIEGAWRFTHEDLVVNQGGVIGGTPSANIVWRNHGTAVVGVFGGDENPTGITGICPDANVRAISIFNSAGASNSAAAIRQAADALSAGDIILIELHRPGPARGFENRDDQLGFIAIEWWPDDFAAIRYAISRGVIVVEAAGNGAENLSAAIYNTPAPGFPISWRNPFNMSNPQSGAIIVGAGAPPPGTHGRNHGTDRSRLDFSNWGARVDVQGWGREVTTCGYGHLQNGIENIWYTDQFSGTSSASPIVVGAIGCMQGRLRARSRPLLTPATALNILRTTGSPQQDTPGRPATQRIGNRPNLKQALEQLGVGAVTKNVIKDIVKDKDLKDRKDKDKEGTKDIIKDKDKDIKEFKDGKEIREVDRDIIQRPEEPGAAGMNERLQNLEQAVQQLAHFITGELRPDLQSALMGNIDATNKNAADSKQSKDTKDTSEV